MITKLQKFYNDCVTTNINRMYQGARSGGYSLVATYEFFPDFLGRERVTQDFIDTVEAFFSFKNCLCEYNDTIKAFKVTIDLNTCLLDNAQSRYYNVSLENLWKDGYMTE